MIDGEDTKSLDDILSSSLGDSYDAAQTSDDGASETPGTDTAAAPAATDGRQRDEQGRFAPKTDSGQAAQDAPAATNPDQGSKPADGAAPAAVAATPSDAPASWSAAAKAHWKTLPPDVQAEAHRREAEFAKGIEQKTQGYRALESVIEPRRLGLAAEYGSVENAIGTLFKLSDFAAQDKPGFIRWFCQAHQLNPQEIFGAIGQTAAAPQPGQDDGGTQPQLPPEVAAALNRVERIEASLIERVEAPIRHKAKSELETFEADAKNVHYQAVKGDMARLLTAAAEQGQEMTYTDAYDAACWARPDIRKQLIETETQSRLAAQSAASAEAARKARTAGGPQLRATGTPSSTRAAPGSIEQTLSETYDRVSGAA